MSNGLSIKNLSLAFPCGAGYAEAVSNCELEVQRGEILGLVGESGSGKSLTALACLGLTPPTCRISGSIRVGGEEVISASDAQMTACRGHQLAMIFQNPMTALNPYFTVGNQLLRVIRQHFSLSASAARNAAIAALEQAGLNEAVLARYPHQMSGGQLQRAMIAMAIACKPKILIADEPTTALDVTVQARILGLLRQLAEQGMGVLLITHDLGVVAQIADRVAVMYSGSVVETGNPEQIFTAPAHPYTRGLVQSLPTMGGGRRKLHAIAGVVPDFRQRLSGCAFRDRCQRATTICAEERLPQLVLAGGGKVHCHFPHLPLVSSASNTTP